MPQAVDYRPQVLVDTTDLSKDDWLAYRRMGIGGSDAAAVLGISPFRTAMDLYYDKRNLPIPNDDDGNWVAMEVGTLLEDLVARIFAQKTGLKVYQRKSMFQHPYHPWMLADLDYLVEMPDGSTAILECKTTNYNARNKWEYDGKPIVPVYYESQGRHYMAVMNLNRVYFCCLFGNNEDEVIIRHIDRDMAYESELIALEEDFWTNNVQAQVPPPYFEDDGKLILESLRRLMGPSVKDAPPVLLTPPQSARMFRFLELQSEKSALDAEVTRLKDEMDRVKALIGFREQAVQCKKGRAGSGVGQRRNDYEHCRSI
nr:YqaJ viral recombinase family protein [uncultured Oscillibacter sp.]